MTSSIYRHTLKQKNLQNLSLEITHSQSILTHKLAQLTLSPVNIPHSSANLTHFLTNLTLTTNLTHYLAIPTHSNVLWNKFSCISRLCIYQACVFYVIVNCSETLNFFHLQCQCCILHDKSNPYFYGQNTEGL